MTDPSTAATPDAGAGGGATRRQKRKALKKLKRRQVRREVAIREREEEEARLNDPEEQLRIRMREQEEAEAAERERRAFEERERLWLEAAAKRKAQEEEEKRRLEEEESHRDKVENAKESEEDDDWEYEDGPAEIIWQGNEIIVKKNRIRVTKKSADLLPNKEDDERPTSNPFPPQSEAFASFNNTPSISAQEALQNVADQIPNFGTEQDKTHCPFHLKTGTCRFGSRCSRVHFYPDKSCTMLMKNMYNGPGLAWEQDEGLEYTDEEVEHYYEDFYEDAHTEFLKFGEIVNFKVCRNGSHHLRGNVYVHYKSLESAILAYNSMNGRYFAGKQITCEFVSVTKWKVAICGEYMKSRLTNCSRGTACNFIHCFRNPGGDYEWADWDNPPPRYWIKKMVALFGYSENSSYDHQLEKEDRERPRVSSRNKSHSDNRYGTRRSSDHEMDIWSDGSCINYIDQNKDRRANHSHRREHSRRRTETDSHDKHKQSEDNHESEVRGHSRKHSRHHDSYDSYEDDARYFLMDHRKSEETTITNDGKRHGRMYPPAEDLDSDKNRTGYLDEQRKSKRRRKSRSYEATGKEKDSPDRYIRCSEDGEVHDGHSGRKSQCMQSIAAEERYDGGCLPHGDASDKDFSCDSSWQSTSHYESKELDRYHPHRDEHYKSDSHGQECKQNSLRKREASNRSFSSDDTNVLGQINDGFDSEESLDDGNGESSRKVEPEDSADVPLGFRHSKHKHRKEDEEIVRKRRPHPEMGEKKGNETRHHKKHSGCDRKDSTRRRV